jgi:hypothetical protein
MVVWQLNCAEADEDEELLVMVNSCKKGVIAAVSGTHPDGTVGLWICRLNEDPSVDSVDETITVKWYEGVCRHGHVVTFELSSNVDDIAVDSFLGCPEYKKSTPTTVSISACL